MDDGKQVHILTLDRRKSGMITGVNEVISFDVAAVILQTCEGLLTIKGHDLHVNKLNLEQGQLNVDGQIDSLTYAKDNQAGAKKESAFTRWLKA